MGRELGDTKNEMENGSWKNRERSGKKEGAKKAWK
jgi:hypothetical protein